MIFGNRSKYIHYHEKAIILNQVGQTDTFKTAARNKCGLQLMAEATKNPPALNPQPASLSSCTISLSIKNLAHDI